MTEAINIYCDESGHLPHDGLPVMVLAAVWCPLDRARAIAAALREVKTRYGCPPGFEAKWSKVSPAGQGLYLGFVDAFFDDPDLHARALVFPDKSKLDHDRFDQDHDTWYFKMYYQLLSALVDQGNRYRIYLDIKDTRSAKRVAKLHGVLANSVYDFQKRSNERI